MKKYLLTTGLTLSLLMSGILGADNASAKINFTDLNSNDSHLENIHYLNNKDAFDGAFSSNFRSSQGVSRTEVAVILHNLYADKLPKIRTYNNNFSDITSSHKKFKEIKWVYEVGIFDGNEKRQFSPNNTLTRSQLAKILVKTFKLESKGNYTFSDVSKSHFAYEYVSILKGHGIAKGYQNKFMPQDNVTRGQFASFVGRTDQTEQIKAIGTPKQKEVINQQTVYKMQSEYNFTWNIYGTDFENLTMFGLNAKNQLVAEYSTQVNKSYLNVKINSDTMNTVRQKLGTPLDGIIKGNKKYLIESYDTNGKNHYDIFLIDNKYVTFFYDINNSYKVRSILWIDKAMEESKPGFYGNVSQTTRNNAEQLLALLVNEIRAKNNVDRLTYVSSWNSIARKHNDDMIKNGFFAHKGSNGKTGIDRMKDAGMQFGWWGENLAYGQYNTIYAYEALVNSKGHKANMLRKEFTHTFVGISYDKNSTPYWTQMFYSLK